MKRKNSYGVGILSDQGEAPTASNLSKYTIYIDVIVGEAIHQSLLSHKPVVFGRFSDFELLRNSTNVPQIFYGLSYKV